MLSGPPGPEKGQESEQKVNCPLDRASIHEELSFICMREQHETKQGNSDAGCNRRDSNMLNHAYP